MKKVIFLFGFIFAAFIGFSYGQDTTNMTGSSGSTGMLGSKAMTQEVIDTENKIIDAVKSKQPDQLGSFLTDNYQGIYSNGIVSKKEDTESIRDVDMRNFSMSDEKVVFPSPDVAILTYKATVSGTMQGKDISGDYNVSSTYVKRNGKWMGVAHTEVKAMQ